MKQVTITEFKGGNKIGTITKKVGDTRLLKDFITKNTKPGKIADFDLNDQDDLEFKYAFGHEFDIVNRTNDDGDPLDFFHVVIKR